MRCARSPLAARRHPAALAGALLLFAPAAARPDACSGLELGTGRSRAVGLAPVAVLALDFNRDGKTDVVTANAGGRDVSLMLGDGRGGLGAAASTAVGLSPADLAAGDLDRDGFPDLVVASATSSTLALLHGTASGFAPPAFFEAEIAGGRAALADFDRDGRLDLVLASEGGNEVRLYAGTGALGFSALLARRTVASPAAVLPGDWNRDGKTDLAVASRGTSRVVVFLGDGRGFLGNGLGDPTPFASVATGTAPLDLAAGDVDGDGRLDLVTADSGAGTVSFLSGAGTGAFTPHAPTLVGGKPIRVGLADLDANGVLDLAVLDDDAGTPGLAVFRGQTGGPAHFPATADDEAALVAGSSPRGLAIARFGPEGRSDLVTAVSEASEVLLVPNVSGPTCPRASFAGAPRSYPTGDGPAAAAAADLDEDGRADLVVAASTGLAIQVLRGGPGGYGVPESHAVSIAPRGVAAADLNVDGHVDVVAALGAPGAGAVQVFLGDGTGGLAARPIVPAGDNLAALVVADFDGNGALDVAVASEGTGQVLVFRGDGAGNLLAPVATATGGGPRALAAGYFDAGSTLDLAVACATGNEIRVHLGAGGGTFAGGSSLPVGASPWSVAAGDLDANGTVDLVTADRGVDPDYRVSVFAGAGNGSFAGRTSYPVDPLPAGLALLRVNGTEFPDVVVATASLHTVNVLRGDGSGRLLPASRHPVRTRPQAIVPVDADGDGWLDVAVPCKGSDAVAILLTRPPAFEAAPRVAVGAQPQGAAAADLNGDGALDLAVANTASHSVSVLFGDGQGGFTALDPALLAGPGASPVAVVAADLDRDGIPDLAVTDAGGGRVLVFRGRGGTFDGPRAFAAGASPDDLAAADVDRDGDLDLLVCNKLAAGTVSLLRNATVAGGALAFTDPRDPDPGRPDEPVEIFPVGDNPTSIFVDDLDRDGRLDFAAANDRSGSATGPYNLSVRYGDGGGFFPRLATLDLQGGEIPFGVTGGDFDGDGDVDLAVAEWGTDTVSFFENRGTAFATPPARVPAPDVPVSVAAAEIDGDGRLDLAVAAAGLSLRRGKLLPPDPLAVNDLVAGLAPSFVVVADWNRDGRMDAAVVNRGSADVSILLSTACAARRLELSLHPTACGAGPGPYPLEAIVEARDDGGNPAVCASGDVTAAIAPGTGSASATLSGTGHTPPRTALSSGVASFTALPAPSQALFIDQPGRRYRLRFSLPGLPPVHSRSFTLGPLLSIEGPASFCAGTPATYTAEASYDTYSWTLTPPGAPPFAYTPAVTLAEPLVSGGRYTLGLSARVDGCAAATARTIWHGTWTRTTLAIAGSPTVCVSCVGGTVTPTDEGGGAVSARQWGYRAAGSSVLTPLPDETGGTYVVKGTDFPGPGTYRLVLTSTFTCPDTPRESEELPVTVSAEVPGGEVQFLAVTSRGTGTAGENLLQWVNSTGSPDEVRIRWRKAPTGTSACVPPLVPEGGTGVEQHVVSPVPVEARSQWLHAPLEPSTAYCYGVFVRQGSTWAPGRIVKARPFDASGPVKWAYSTGATALVPPTVGPHAVLAMSNDRAVHAVERGAAGGAWPAGFVPHALRGIAHSRSPVIPFRTPIDGADSLLFVGDDLGWIEGVNARTGQGVWEARAPSVPAQSIVTGAPGAILSQYGGGRDLVIVGTRRDPASGPSEVLGLDPAGAGVQEVFSGGGTPFRSLGPVSGSPSVDYARQRVYFASRRRGTDHTVWALDVTPSSLAYAWSLDPGGEFDTSPISRGDRVYVADTTGHVHSIDATDRPGLPRDVRSMSTNDGPVRGFVFPDRGSDRLYFATNTKVWSVSDTPSGFVTRWTWTAPGLSPSIVLYAPLTTYVYFGGRDGKLYQLDFSHDPASPEFVKSVTLGDGAGRIGPPSLDVVPPGVAPGEKMLLVGSESSVLYGVVVPLR